MKEPSNRQVTYDGGVSMAVKQTLGVAVLALWQALAFAQDGPVLRTPVSIDINSQRPLAQALLQIQDLTHTPINFEETPYQNPNDIVSRTVTGVDGRQVRLVSPKGGHLRASLDKGESGYEAIQTLLSGYYTADLPGSYVVTQTATSVNILPGTFLNLSGVSQTAAPLMDQLISFPEAARNIPATFQLVVDGMAKATGVNVLLSDVPFPDYSPISVGASQESAASVLAKIASKLRPFSCFLLYDPGAKAYHLTVRIVPLAPGSTSASQSQPGVSPGVTRPTQSPFFKKDKLSPVEIE